MIFLPKPMIRESTKPKGQYLESGKIELRITKQLIKDAQEQCSETAEKVFNEAIGITQSELENNTIYQPEYIINKLSGVISNYVSSEMNNDN